MKWWKRARLWRPSVLACLPEEKQLSNSNLAEEEVGVEKERSEDVAAAAKAVEEEEKKEERRRRGRKVSLRYLAPAAAEVAVTNQVYGKRSVTPPPPVHLHNSPLSRSR